jgi:hypothetical protein
MFRVKATRRADGGTWYAYNGATFTRAMADVEARECNRMWGDEITFEVVAA